MIDNMMAHTTWVHTVKSTTREDIPALVYPTLTTGIVNIEAEQSSKEQVQDVVLMNADGKILKRYGAGAIKRQIDIGNNPPGLYYLKVATAHKQKTYKITLTQ